MSALTSQAPVRHLPSQFPRRPAGQPIRTGSPVIDHLNSEWVALCASDTTSAVRRWATQCPELVGCMDLEDVWERSRGADPGTADAILRALLRAGQAGDQLALRTVFQRMLGAAFRRGITYWRRGYWREPECGQQIAAALWDAIATYPLERRPVKIAANLTMETVGRLSTAAQQVWSARTREVLTDPTDTRQEAACQRATTRQPRDTIGASTVELLKVVAWGVETGTIRASDAELLIRVYCPPPGARGGAAVAAEMGVNWATLRKRCSRAAQRLARAVERHKLTRGEFAESASGQ